jgi:hypothetical protein
VTLRSLRDADAERPMDSGERLLDSVVATSRCASLWSVCGADRLRTQLCAVEPAIERELAGGLRWKRIGDDGTTNG